MHVSLKILLVCCLSNFMWASQLSSPALLVRTKLSPLFTIEEGVEEELEITPKNFKNKDEADSLLLMPEVRNMNILLLSPLPNKNNTASFSFESPTSVLEHIMSPVCFISREEKIRDRIKAHNDSVKREVNTIVKAALIRKLLPWRSFISPAWGKHDVKAIVTLAECLICFDKNQNNQKQLQRRYLESVYTHVAFKTQAPMLGMLTPLRKEINKF